MTRIIVGASLAFALAALQAGAGAQEALPTEYGFKLAARTSEASYFLSGLKRGAEPESMEAWVWTVTSKPAGSEEQEYDARAQWSVLRCTGKTIEPLRTEFYLKGKFLKTVEAPFQTPVDVKPGSPMAPVWSVACDSSVRFNAENVQSIDQVYDIAQGR